MKSIFKKVWTAIFDFIPVLGSCVILFFIVGFSYKLGEAGAAVSDVITLALFSSLYGLAFKFEFSSVNADEDKGSRS